MAELSALRARLKDRQVKEGALGTVEVSICLDLSLIAELAEMEEQQAQWELDHPASAPGSLAGKATVPVNPVDAEVEAKQDEIRAASIIVLFKALSSQRYQEVINRYEDPDDAQRAEWFDALIAECFSGCWSEGEKVALTWDEVKDQMSFGEMDEVRTRVYSLNRRKQDIPFSSRPSRKPRPLAATPKPA